MKALTICQPYADLILSGEKRVENRNWHTRYRCAMLIHAGKSRAWMEGRQPPPEMIFGAILGIVNLVACIHIDEINKGKYDQLFPWVRNHAHTDGPWCWILEHPRRFDEPIPFSGKQGLWDVSTNDLKQRPKSQNLDLHF